MLFCNTLAIAGAGIYEFTLDIGGCEDDLSFRFLLIAKDGSGTYNLQAADEANADWIYRFYFTACHLV